MRQMTCASQHAIMLRSTHEANLHPDLSPESGDPVCRCSLIRMSADDTDSLLEQIGCGMFETTLFAAGNGM